MNVTIVIQTTTSSSSVLFGDVSHVRECQPGEEGLHNFIYLAHGSTFPATPRQAAYGGDICIESTCCEGRREEAPRDSGTFSPTHMFTFQIITQGREATGKAAVVRSPHAHPDEAL